MESIAHESRKTAFDITKVLACIRRAIKPYPKAMLFELAERGFGSVFHQVCACILSVRTLDETSLKTSLRLFERAASPKEMLLLSVDEIRDLIFDSTFAGQKAPRLWEIARIAQGSPGGDIACDFESLTALPGVGPKCAGLVLGIACGKAAIGVDIHVHRVTHRWGYTKAATPEKTLRELQAKLPRKHWVEINELLVPFGKNICTGAAPKCSTCPVLDSCEQVGVSRHR